MPKLLGNRLGEPKLKALVAALVDARAVMKPYVVVTGTELPMPFTAYSPLGDVLLDGKRPPRGMRVSYRGENDKTLLAALRRRPEDDVVVYFSDVPPLHEDIANERTHAVLLYALASPRGMTLHQAQFDENLNEIPNSALGNYRVCNTVVVLGTEIDGPKHHPVRKLRTVLAKHLGAIDIQLNILH
ncbi:MAG: hypothetical protein ABI467_20090 [Kofleriaceae bacterium]